MGNVRTEIAISARSADVWRVLFDTAVYPLWNPLVTAVRGLPEEGRTIRIRLKVKSLPPLWVPVVVETLLPGERLCWTFTLPFGLFRAEHCFLLSKEADGGTRFVNDERFSGLLGEFAGIMMNRLFRGDYEGMDRALARRVGDAV